MITFLWTGAPRFRYNTCMQYTAFPRVILGYMQDNISHRFTSHFFLDTLCLISSLSNSSRSSKSESKSRFSSFSSVFCSIIWKGNTKLSLATNKSFILKLDKPINHQTTITCQKLNLRQPAVKYRTRILITLVSP